MPSNAVETPNHLGDLRALIMHALVADTVPQDDIALVVIRRTDEG